MQMVATIGQKSLCKRSGLVIVTSVVLQRLNRIDLGKIAQTAYSASMFTELNDYRQGIEIMR
jgi:hypothetical protein